MGFRLRTYIRGGLLFLISGHLVSEQSLAVKTIDQQTPAITVFVYNSARVSSPDLARSEQEAGTIFRQAGIASAWVDCTGSSADICHHPAGPNQFVLHIVPGGQTSTDAVFGVAFLGPDGIGKYSDVFYNRIEQMHRDFGTSPAQLLGTVAAHEIGHLLLGSNSHSLTGVMSPRWNRQELERVGMGRLGFSAEQSSRMRARIEDEHNSGDHAQFASTGTK